MNGIKPEIRDCVVENKHQTKYVLGPLAMATHAQHLWPTENQVVSFT